MVSFNNSIIISHTDKGAAYFIVQCNIYIYVNVWGGGKKEGWSGVPFFKSSFDVYFWEIVVDISVILSKDGVFLSSNHMGIKNMRREHFLDHVSFACHSNWWLSLWRMTWWRGSTL